MSNENLPLFYERIRTKHLHNQYFFSQNIHRHRTQTHQEAETAMGTQEALK